MLILLYIVYGASARQRQSRGVTTQRNVLGLQSLKHSEKSYQTWIKMISSEKAKL